MTAQRIVGAALIVIGLISLWNQAHASTCLLDEREVHDYCWTQRAGYADLPLDWRAEFYVMKVNTTGWLMCKGVSSRSCAVVLGPLLPCRVIVATQGLNPEQSRALVQHELMHCSGWVHR